MGSIQCVMRQGGEAGTWGAVLYMASLKGLKICRKLHTKDTVTQSHWTHRKRFTLKDWALISHDRDRQSLTHVCLWLIYYSIQSLYFDQECLIINSQNDIHVHVSNFAYDMISICEKLNLWHGIRTTLIDRKRPL